jgi:hypothetical protein
MFPDEAPHNPFAPVHPGRIERVDALLNGAVQDGIARFVGAMFQDARFGAAIIQSVPRTILDISDFMSLR